MEIESRRMGWFAAGALAASLGMAVGWPASPAIADDAARAAERVSAEDAARPLAAEEADPRPEARPGRNDVHAMPAITVVGSQERARRLPGSAALLDTADIRDQSYDDVNRVLRKVPGVYVREEDGFGLFPNISIRGVDTTRSAKVTLMEDGVLTAPAPYAAPAAYYSPSIARMAGLEILKGSSQVRFGPHITGGVINYLSTPIPNERTAYARTIFGTDAENRIHAYLGDTMTTPVGPVGVLLEGYFRETEGFKRIDETPDFRDGEETGFRVLEPMLKLSWELPTTTYQFLEYKLGYTDGDANETYLGLSEADFADDPQRRYSASRFDTIQREHTRTFLRHFIAPSADVDVTTTLYYNKFRRNWFKLNDLRAIPGVGNLGLSEALAGAADGAGLAVLRGEAEGTLRVRNNNRMYYLWGAESVGTWRTETAGLAHEVIAGVRYHADRERRFQRDELFVQAANGTIVDRDPGEPGGAGNRTEEAEAVAMFVQDEIRIGRLALTPGIRFEYLWLDSEDRAAPDGDGDTSLALVGGGVGATYDVSDQWLVLGGVHRGFSPPDPGAAVRSGLDEETSIATELGVRYQQPEQAFAAETIGFFTYFDDLIVIDNIGGTGTGESENVGRVNTAGLELAAQWDPGVAHRWRFGNPWHLAFTYTHAEQRSDSDSEDAESIFAGGKKGNRVPYIPEFVLSFGTAIEIDRLSISFVGNVVDETFTTANNTRRQLNAAGDPDARFGTTDSFVTADFAVHYRFLDNVALVAGVQNAFDAEYVVSRHPHGPRPGPARFGYGGVELRF